MSNVSKKNKNMIKNITLERTISIYRYISWTLTSLVYYATVPNSILMYKIGVVVTLFVVTRYLSTLYLKFKDNNKIIKNLVFVETIGIEFLLLATGGLESPFMWYALNPILVAACYLPALISWINLFFYLSTCPLISYVIFNTEDLSIVNIFINNLNLILILILINLAMQFLSLLAKELQKSNFEKENAIDQIMSLYQMTEALNNHSSAESLIDTLTEYTNNLTKCNSLFWIIDEDILKFSDKDLQDIELLRFELNDLNIEDIKNNNINNVKLANKSYIIIPLLTPTSFFGLGGIEIRKYLNINEYNRITKLFKFISELLSVVLERFNLENIEENLLLMEEQNRIANEMHDSVSQRLFSISFGLHGILGKLDSVSKDVLTGYLTEIQESSNEAMKELRKAIYKLSSKKNGDKYLQKAIKSIANSISILNDIQTELNFSGKEYYLNYELKKSILRIIREACSNAVKHGNCKNIVVSISIGKESVNLSIQDDGCGFIFDDSGDKYGLGLSNMKTLTKLFHGNINIKSDIGIGTKIEVVMPIHANNLQKGAMAI